MRKLLLGIDIGTSSCKVSIIDRKGNLVSSGKSEYPTFHQLPNWSEQNPEDWYQGFKVALKSALKFDSVKAKEIIAIGVAASTHNAVLLDYNMKILRNSIMWTDQRSTQEARWLNDNYGKDIFNITYQTPSPTWTLSHLLWLQKNEEDIFKKVKYLLFTKDYLRYKLTGTWETDFIDAQGSMLIDVRTKEWSSKICEISSISKKILPPIFGSLKVAGVVTKEAAKETGLHPDVPVIVGTSDTAAESFGGGILEAGQCIVKIATAGTINVFTGEPYPHPQSLTYSYVVPGLWYTCMATNSAAESMRWYSKVFYSKEFKSKKKESNLIYKMIDKEAKEVKPGSDGLFFHPYLMGERSPYWDPNLRASFVGVSAYHKRAHFSRAIMEGVAYSLKNCFELIDVMKLTVNEVRFIGGGSKSNLWKKILSDILGKPILIPAHNDSSFGVAMLAGVGVGIFKDLKDAVKKCVKINGKILPNEKDMQYYQKMFAIYKKIHDDLVGTYQTLVKLN